MSDLAGLAKVVSAFAWHLGLRSMRAVGGRLQRIKVHQKRGSRQRKSVLICAFVGFECK